MSTVSAETLPDLYLGETDPEGFHPEPDSPTPRGPLQEAEAFNGKALLGSLTLAAIVAMAGGSPASTEALAEEEHGENKIEVPAQQGGCRATSSTDFDAYDAPSLTATVIGRIYANEFWPVIGTTSNSSWYQVVNRQGRQGWVKAPDVTLVGCQVPPPVLRWIDVAVTPVPTPIPTSPAGDPWFEDLVVEFEFSPYNFQQIKKDYEVNLPFQDRADRWDVYRCETTGVEKQTKRDVVLSTRKTNGLVCGLIGKPDPYDHGDIQKAASGAPIPTAAVPQGGVDPDVLRRSATPAPPPATTGGVDFSKCKVTGVDTTGNISLSCPTAPTAPPVQTWGGKWVTPGKTPCDPPRSHLPGVYNSRGECILQQDYTFQQKIDALKQDAQDFVDEVTR